MIHHTTKVKQNDPSKRQPAVLETTTLSEHKQVGLVIETKDGVDSDQVCLDTPTTSSTTDVERTYKTKIEEYKDEKVKNASFFRDWTSRLSSM